jgi:biopolymer transport protein ExbD
MSFYPRRRRQAPPIIIISLIDVLIVMLVFLLVTTTFRSQPAVKLELPESSQGLKAGAGAEKPPLEVTIAAGEPHFYVGTRPVTEVKLLSELKSAAAADPDVHLILRADREARWGLVVKARDFAQQAKIKSVKAYTKAAGGR